jgi:hypothetical protein
MEYCAPLSGEYQQTVQMADLDGNGKYEYLVFAKSTDERPMRILIFCQVNDRYVLTETIEGNGSSFDMVEYVQMDDKKGVELIVGRQLSGQVLRSVSVYTFSGGRSEQLISASYTKFVSCDMDSDNRKELLILRPGQTDTDKGIAELYGVENGIMERSNEVNMSEPVDKLKRIVSGRLNDGTAAVFTASAVGENAIITDVFALVDGVFTNVSFSNESGTSVQTLRNYYVYADDLDEDMVVELPSLINMKPMGTASTVSQQYLIRWYAMEPDGSEVDKMYTYHNYFSGWFLQLEKSLAARITVVQRGSSYVIYLWNEEFTATQKLLTIYSFSGQDRHELAVTDGRFLLLDGESVVYAAKLEVTAYASGFTEESVKQSFHLIKRDWKTGET